MWATFSGGLDKEASNHFWHKHLDAENGTIQLVLRTILYDSTKLLATKFTRNDARALNPHCPLCLHHLGQRDRVTWHH